MVELNSTSLYTMVVWLLAFTGSLILWGGIIYLSIKKQNKHTKRGLLALLTGATLLAGGVLIDLNAINPALEGNVHKVKDHYGISSVQKVGGGELTSLKPTEQDIPVIFADNTYPENLGILRVRDGEANLMVSLNGEFTEYQSR